MTRPAPAILAAILLVAVPGWASPAATIDDIVVHVRKDGQEISMDVDLPVDAPWPVVWDVLTDYDHMAQFITNLEHSGVEKRDGNVLVVHQRGKATHGPLSMKFDNVREIELVPYHEIRSQLVRGDFKASSFTTRIVKTGTQLHIVNVGRYTPNIWVPPYIGPLVIAAEAKKQFGEIRAEILRRSAELRP